jgi:hypothetical protein
MINRIVNFFLLALVFSGCGTKEFDCDDMPIQPAFIGFQLADIDTLIFRQYQPNDNFRNLIDTTLVTYDNLYRTSNDTTKIIHYQLSDGIKPGFDWQLFIPPLNRTVVISNIISDQKTGSCGTMASRSACTCLNDLFSAKQDSQVITFPDVNKEAPFIYIRK